MCAVKVLKGNLHLKPQVISSFKICLILHIKITWNTNDFIPPLSLVTGKMVYKMVLPPDVVTG